jgi:hypothetical protein
MGIMPTEPLATFVRLCESGGLDLPLPGSGRTLDRFNAFADWGRQDLVLARLAEGHADASAIRMELAGAGPPSPSERWGVWAAVPLSVTARPAGGRQWILDGERPWCSGAGACTHALVAAQAPDGQRLFAVEVKGPRWPRWMEPGRPWVWREATAAR